MFEKCIVGDTDYDGRTICERKTKSRKQWRCCECLRTITIGESYYATKIVSEDGFWTERTCSTCHDVRKSLMRGSWCFGELWTSVGYAYCQDDEDRRAMLPETFLRVVK